MKNSVTINGITLTREQIEAAVLELQWGAVTTPGARVKLNPGGVNEYIVMDADSGAGAAAAEWFGFARKTGIPVMLLDLSDGRITWTTADSLMEVS